MHLSCLFSLLIHIYIYNFINSQMLILIALITLFSNFHSFLYVIGNETLYKFRVLKLIEYSGHLHDGDSRLLRWLVRVLLRSDGDLESVRTSNSLLVQGLIQLIGEVDLHCRLEGG